jgi:NTP pyrophosphatase (non-canonical NTP hydrolase)
MTPEQYRDEIEDMDRQRYPSTDWYLALGLVGEAAEVQEKILLGLGLGVVTGAVADKVKKSFRNPPNDTKITPRDLALELGDTLWYLDRLALKYGFTLGEVMELNIVKLRDRIARGTFAGHGDHR